MDRTTSQKLFSFLNGKFFSEEEEQALLAAVVALEDKVAAYEGGDMGEITIKHDSGSSVHISAKGDVILHAANDIDFNPPAPFIFKKTETGFVDINTSGIIDENVVLEALQVVVEQGLFAPFEKLGLMPTAMEFHLHRGEGQGRDLLIRSSRARVHIFDGKTVCDFSEVD